MTDRGGTFGCLLLGGPLAMVSTSQAWWRAASGGASAAFTGTEVTAGLSQALAVVALAGTLLVLVLQARGRRVLAVLLALTGGAVVLVGLLRRDPGADAVRTKLRQLTLSDTFDLLATGWPWCYAGAGLLILAGAVLLWRGAPRWAPRADRFARPSPTRTADSASAALPTGAPQVTSADDDPAVVWRALDAGLDPTEEPADGSDGRAPHDPAVGPAPWSGRDDAGDRPDVRVRDPRGHNGDQDHTDFPPVRSDRADTTTGTHRPSPRIQGD